MDELKVQLFIAISLDGFIAREDGGIDWLFSDGDYGYAAFYAQIDALVMGRKTFDQVLSFGEWPYADKPCFVCTRRDLPNVPEPVVAVAGDAEQIVATILVHGCRQIWLVGGGEVVAAFRAQRLIDEYILTVHPVLLGAGIPLFTPLPLEEPLQLLNTKTYPSGLVQLHYTLAIQRDPT